MRLSGHLRFCAKALLPNGVILTGIGNEAIRDRASRPGWSSLRSQ
jgi:hypothetical protein